MAENIKSFESLSVWQESQTFAVEVYKVTKSFPKEELFGLTSQIRRAVSSVSANIAEGFGRVSPKDKLHFYAIAYGSLLESKSHLYLAHKLSYLSDDELDSLKSHITSCQKLLNAFIASIKK